MRTEELGSSAAPPGPHETLVVPVEHDLAPEVAALALAEHWPDRFQWANERRRPLKPEETLHALQFHLRKHGDVSEGFLERYYAEEPEGPIHSAVRWAREQLLALGWITQDGHGLIDSAISTEPTAAVTTES